MQQPERNNQKSTTGNADEWARRLTIILGAPLALFVSGLALIQFL